MKKAAPGSSRPGHPATLLTSWPPYSRIAVTLVGLWLLQSAFNVAPLHTSLPGITAAEPVAGIVPGIVVFGDSIRVSPGLLLEASGLIVLLIGVSLVARSRHSRVGTDPDHPGFELHPARKMAATGS